MYFNIKGLSAVAMATGVFADGYGGYNPKHDDCNADMVPTQIRIAYAGTNGMAVSWNTDGQIVNPKVYFGRGSELEKSASSSKSVTYPTSLTWNNHVTITGLEPDTKYKYRVECDTQVYTFRTARVAGDGRPFKFAMIGDMGTFGPDGLSTTVAPPALNPLKPGEHTTIQSALSMKKEYDFIIHVGDIAYADAWLKEETNNYITNPLGVNDAGAEYDKILNEFFNQTEVLSVDRPYMVVAGNHEANCDNKGSYPCPIGQTNFTGYRNHWNMPSAQSKGFENFWYSFDHGMIHFIGFNTETDYPNAADEPGGEGAENAGPFQPSGTQIAWLQADLAKVDRKKTPWVIAAGHRPWYVSTSACIECQAAFEPIFIAAGVDLVIHGHKHFYDRQAAVATVGGQVLAQEITANPQYPWYVTNGAAGHYDGLDIPSSFSATSRDLINGTYGWNLFTVHNCSYLTTEFIRSGDNVVLDSATLYKKRSCACFNEGKGDDKHEN